eukprot:scaffold201306_cov17-Tisochrysis_lutea.AAC.1
MQRGVPLGPCHFLIKLKHTLGLHLTPERLEMRMTSSGGLCAGLCASKCISRHTLHAGGIVQERA